jgi:hypothetical protein
MVKVLMIGSGLSAEMVNDYRYKENDWIICTVNNAFRVTPQWKYAFFSKDYQKGKRPYPQEGKIIVDGEQIVFASSQWGGLLRTGLSVTIQSSYWVLKNLKPHVMGYLGSDMNYKKDKRGWTTFYGLGADIKFNGISDPDRMAQLHGGGNPNYIHDVYKLLEENAAKQGCKLYNFSDDPKTRLPFPKITAEEIDNQWQTLQAM